MGAGKSIQATPPDSGDNKVGKFQRECLQRCEVVLDRLAEAEAAVHGIRKKGYISMK
jgi:hypothetical protein